MTNLSFWKRKRRSRYSKDFRGLPTLPQNIDDTAYIAAASNAAQVDRASGAYDQFLFSEDRLKQMPFEDSVDAHLSLIEIRLKDKGRREALVHEKALLEARADLSKVEHKLGTLENRLLEQQANLLNQSEILEGNKAGKSGLIWKGSPSELSSKAGARLKLALPIIIFAIVGLVDLGIIINSFTKIPGFKFMEAIIFTAPAVGVQLVFPHFIGHRINLLIHRAKKTLNIIELSILFVLWLVFAWVLTEIRMNYIKVTAATAEPLSGSLELFLYAGNFLMLLGLGAWLMLIAARSNPHEFEHRRINLAIQVLRSKIDKHQGKKAAILAEIPTLELALTVFSESYKDAADSSKTKLAEAVKSEYRRSLINHMGSVEFTAAYTKENPKAGLESRARHD